MVQCKTTLLQSNCISKESVTATQHGFQQQSKRHDATSLLWVSEWHQGSVRTVSVHSQLIHLTIWSQYAMPNCKTCTGQLVGKLSCCTQWVTSFTKFSTRTCITNYTKYKLLRNSCEGHETI
jgi:hypothetical protein